MYESIEEIIAALRIQRDLLKQARDKLADRGDDLAAVSDALDDAISFLTERKPMRGIVR